MNKLSAEQQRIVQTYRSWIGDVALDALPEFIRDRISQLSCAFGRAGVSPKKCSACWPNPYAWEEMEADLRTLMDGLSVPLEPFDAGK